MNLPRHRLSREVFAALAAGGGGHEAVRELGEAEYSKHLILLRGVLATARDSEQFPLALAGYGLLAAAWRANRAATEKVIRYPSVGSWALRTIRACRGGPTIPGAEPGGLRAVGATAAIRAGLAAEIEVATTEGRIILPSLGAALVPGGTAVVRCANGRATVGPVDMPTDPYHDAPGWLGLRRIRARSLTVVVDDLDPFRMPDAPSLAPRLTAEPWGAGLRRAWMMLERDHPVAAAEIAAAVSVIVPRCRPPAGAVSTTSPEAFGAIAMSPPLGPVSCAETLVHEVQHIKLAALLDLVALTLPDDGRRYYAPWRDDPRPLAGLLQGTYAYLGVAGFWRRQHQLARNRRRAEAKYARRRAAVAMAVETLRSSGRLTDAGLDFVSGMARTLDHWQGESVSAQAETEARRAAESHLARWQLANGPSPV